MKKAARFRKDNEALIKRQVRKVLDKHGAYTFMPVQMGMGAAGLDFHCCIDGVAVFIETKAPGKKLTPRQIKTTISIVKAGGIVLVIDGGHRYLSPEQLDYYLHKMPEGHGAVFADPHSIKIEE